MQPDAPPPPWYDAGHLGWVPVVAATEALALLAPGLYLASSFTEYFVTYRCDRLDLVLYLTGLALPPLLGLGLARRLLPARAGEALTQLVAVAFAAIFAGHVLVRLPGLSLGPTTALLLGLVPALVVLRGARRPLARRWAQALATAVALAPHLLFLFGGDLWAHLGRELPPGAAPPPTRPTPVLMVIFDELPTSSLITPDGHLDRARFPGLAAVADVATWYPDTTAVHSYTRGAIPGILTGRYPRRRRLPVAQDYPQNLLRLLAPAMPVISFEGGSNLYENSRGAAAGAYRDRTTRLTSLWQDAAVLASALARPDATGAAVLQAAAKFDFFRQGQMQAGPARGAGFGGLQAFVGHPQLQRPGMFYLHTTLPHGPYQYGAGGGLYVPYDPAPIQMLELEGEDGGKVPVVSWTADTWLVRHTHQRHLMQAMCADALFARLWEAWRARPDFAESLVVVTADHGHAFEPGGLPRHLHGADALARAEILGVPLFVKYPGQTEARVDRRPVETTDIVPTVARALGLALPEPPDGLALQDPPPPARTRRAYDVDQRETVHQVTPADIQAASARRRAWYHHPEESDPYPWPYRLGELGAWVGRPLPAGRGPPATARLYVAPDRPRARAGLEGLLGELAFDDPTLVAGEQHLVASLDDEVVGVTRLSRDGPAMRPFLVLFPPRDAAKPGDFRLWLRSPGSDALRPIEGRAP